MRKKRVLALALAAAMSLGVVASVAAEDKEIKEATGSAEGSVTAEVKGFDEPLVHTYLVTVTIPEMSFEYKMGTLGNWDTTELKYGTPTDKGWQGSTTAEITVTNKSDAAVGLTCKYASTPAVDGVTGTISLTRKRAMAQ